MLVLQGIKAGDENRTHMTSLEGWGSTIELRPLTRAMENCTATRGNPTMDCLFLQIRPDPGLRVFIPQSVKNASKKRASGAARRGTKGDLRFAGRDEFPIVPKHRAAKGRIRQKQVEVSEGCGIL
jgi:hypothetical protein